MLLKHCVCICFRRACRIYNCHKAFILSRLAMKIDFSWQNTEFRRCYFINKTYESFLTSKMLNELALISLRWLYARWSTPSVLICCSYCNIQNTHICVKGNKKKPLDKIRKKKTTWQDSQRIQVEFSIRFYRYFYGKLHIYTRFNQLEKNDSYKTFGLVAVLRLCDLLVFSSGWYIYEIAMNRIALFRWFKDNASSLKDNI